MRPLLLCTLLQAQPLPLPPEVRAGRLEGCLSGTMGGDYGPIGVVASVPGLAHEGRGGVPPTLCTVPWHCCIRQQEGLRAAGLELWMATPHRSHSQHQCTPGPRGSSCYRHCPHHANCLETQQRAHTPSLPLPLSDSKQATGGARVRRPGSGPANLSQQSPRAQLRHTQPPLGRKDRPTWLPHPQQNFT